MGTVARGAKSGGGQNFNAGQVIDPAEVNQDFNTLYAEVNGLLDDTNLETGTLPGAKSLRFTEISTPSSPSSNDVLLYAKDDGAGVSRLYTKDAASITRLVTPSELQWVNVQTNGTAADTTLTILQQHTLAAGLMALNFDRVRLTGYGTFAANANAKTILLTFGGSNVAGVAGAFNNVNWYMTADILRTGATTQSAFGTTLITNSAVTNTLTSPTSTLTNTILCTISAQNGTASANDIQAVALWVEFMPHQPRA